MLDINKQIDYWTKGAISDIETAELLLTANKHIEGLFFCHLTIEKILKALMVKNTNQLAPKSHNLIYLSELAKVNLSDDNTSLLSVLMKYQIEGRYPEYIPKAPSNEIANDYLCKTKALLECLRQML
jgi:HEPN domain-containing protein